MPLESTHVKAPDGSGNGKWIKMDLTPSFPEPFSCSFLVQRVSVYGLNNRDDFSTRTSSLPAINLFCSIATFDSFLGDTATEA
jgi:hypothetical protein